MRRRSFLGLTAGTVGTAMVPKIVRTAPDPTVCRAGWFDRKNLSAGCFDAAGVAGVVLLTYHFRDGAYSPFNNSVEFFARDTDGKVKLFHQSQLTTSRRGAFTDSQVRVRPYTVDTKGLAGFPLFSLAGTDGFRSGDWSMLHGPIGDGNDFPVPGSRASDACWRVLKGWDYLKRSIQTAQKRGSVIAVIRHTSAKLPG